MKQIFLLGLAVLGLGLSTPTLRADEIVSVYLGTGLPETATYEAIDATFEWDVTTETLVPGTFIIYSNTGPLDPFSFIGEQSSPSYDGPGYVFEFENDDGDQWYVNTLPVYSPPPDSVQIPYSFEPGTIDYVQDRVYCGSTTDTCYADDFYGYYLLEGGVIVSPVSEPSSLALALAGIAALIFVRFRANKQRAAR